MHNDGSSLGTKAALRSRLSVPQWHHSDGTLRRPELRAVALTAETSDNSLLPADDASSVGWPVAEVSEVCHTSARLAATAIYRGRCHRRRTGNGVCLPF